MRDELYKQRWLRDAIFEHCYEKRSIFEREKPVMLREKMWIQTRHQGYQFTADRVVCSYPYHKLKCIEIYGTYGIHCSVYLLDSRQLKELAELLPFHIPYIEYIN